MVKNKSFRRTIKNTQLFIFISGIILVHDLSNRKSQQNLQKWLQEVLSKDGNSSRTKSFDDFDPERFVGSTQVSIFIFTHFINPSMAHVSKRPQ